MYVTLGEPGCKSKNSQIIEASIGPANIGIYFLKRFGINTNVTFYICTMRIVFMGTPEFAVPCLDILIRNNYNVVAVVTVQYERGSAFPHPFFAGGLRSADLDGVDGFPML